MYVVYFRVISPCRIHLAKYGISEGRVASPAFDVKYYVENNADLSAAFGTDYEAAYNHFLTYGIYEGRATSPVFDVQYYLANNADLSAAFGPTGYEAAFNHFIQYGMNEGRVASANFDVKHYIANYADLKAAFGTNYAQGFVHYLTYGMAEGRTLIGHVYNSGEVTTAATCKATGVKTYTCTVCGATKTATISKTSHTWDDGEETTAATCTEEGVMTYTCTVCDTTKTEPIDALGHNNEEYTIQEKTCTQNGITVTECTRCGAFATVTDPATGHSYVENPDESESAWTWAVNEENGGYTATVSVKCSVEGCDEENTEATLTATVTSVVTQEASCGVDEITTYTATATDDYGNTFTDTNEVVTEEGPEHTSVYYKSDDSYEYFVCTTCGNQVTKDHSYAYTDNEDESTHSATCSNEYCGQTISSEAHEYGEAVAYTDKAYLELTYATCTDCKYVQYYEEDGTIAHIVTTITDDDSLATAIGVAQKDSDHNYKFVIDGQYVNSLSTAILALVPSNVEVYAEVDAVDEMDTSFQSDYIDYTVMVGDITLTSGPLKVLAGDTAVLYLNDYTFSSKSSADGENDSSTGNQLLWVYGNLTIDDKGTNGTGKVCELIDSTTGGSGWYNGSDVVDNGVLTINGGTIEANSAFAFFSKRGGKIIVNGGTISSKYSCLNTNNTVSYGTFEVNGGTLKSSFGPAIYLANMDTLTITGGTVYGIDARMGNITISGGEIYAPESTELTTIQAIITDSSADQSGPLPNGDAITILGGWYSSYVNTVRNEGIDTVTTYTDNTLTLTITGGTISAANNTTCGGSALAIYDVGKCTQTVNVNITGGTFTGNTDNSACKYVAFTSSNTENLRSEYGVVENAVTLAKNITATGVSIVDETAEDIVVEEVQED